jgi:hypothetical protein
MIGLAHRSPLLISVPRAFRIGLTALALTTPTAAAMADDVTAAASGSIDRPQGRCWDDGRCYAGYWLRGEPHGWGMLSFANGDYYEGAFVSGRFHGDGRYVFAAGDSYSGQWVDGIMQGTGTYTWRDGASFTGTMVWNAPNGIGTCSLGSRIGPCFMMNGRLSRWLGD